MELQIEKLHNQAVDAALARNWDQAIKLNLRVLEMDEDNVDALLALSFAHLEKGDLKKAKQSYSKTLKVDPTNVIARNNNEKIAILLKKGSSHTVDEELEVSHDPDTFINIKGKTRSVTLMSVGQADTLAKLKIGEKVDLQVKKRRLEARSKKGEYIGCLPDDVSKRLIFFIEADSEYNVYVKSATKNSVDIFVCEKVKGTKVEHYISFPDNIQDDMKMFMGKEDDEDSDGDDADSDDNDASGDDDEASDLLIDDIEELANDEDDKDEYFGIDASDHEDDDSDE